MCIGKYCIMIKNYTIFADIYFSQVLKKCTKFIGMMKYNMRLKRR